MLEQLMDEKSRYEPQPASFFVDRLWLYWNCFHSP